MKAYRGCLAAALGLLSAHGAVWAEAPVAAPQTASTPVGFGEAARIGADELGTIAGQADIQMVVNAQNRSTVANNSVEGNSVTGTIGFDSQSFQNLSGLSVVSANTGNNVSINSSLNVNVAVNP